MLGLLRRRATLATLAFAALTPASQAGVMMQAFYWDVPSPAAGQDVKVWWWDRVAKHAKSWREAGFTSVWLPPVTKGAGGGYSVGYDPYDDYDLGSKDQKGTRPTRYGTRQQLQRLCATLRANNLDILADLVLNHRNGDDGYFNFRHPDAYGAWGKGRFGKTAQDFRPARPLDRETPEDTSSFGRDLAYSDNPILTNGMKANGDWLTKALDLQGYRLDYVKGVGAEFLRDYLNSQSMAGKFAVGEFFDGDIAKIRNWTDGYMRGRTSAFDFPLRYVLKDMCLNPSGFDMRRLHRAGLAGVDPFKAVTFVENHDTDLHDPIYQNKALAYAYILTSEGYPCVFYRDYAQEPGSYGMKPLIDNLIWIREKLASGATVERWMNDKVYCFERTGGSRLLVALNNNIGTTYRITVQTGFGPNVRLVDYTGQAPDVWTNGSGQATIEIPRAVNGRGYCAYAPAGLGGSTFSNIAKSTTQEFAGASDLDLFPADPFFTVPVATVSVAARRPVTTSFYYDATDWTDATVIELTAVDPRGRVLQRRALRKATIQGATATFAMPQPGNIRFLLRTRNTPTTNTRPRYWLKVTYTAPQFPITAG